MLKVLVVDDDPEICLLTRRLLTTLGCDSYEAKNGFDALAMVDSVHPDLVLLDVMMPIQDGYETCKRIRAAGYTGPIIMVSALQQHAEAVSTQAAGANAYVQKPITRSVIQFHIDHILARQRAHPEK
jgi:CheY-like chemotaxis protein